MSNELNPEEIEFAQDVKEVEALAEQEQALVKYVPKSKAPFQLDTLIPRNMAFEVQKALNRIVKLHGNIDNYVRDQLRYSSTKELWNALAAEQVDSIALYLHQFRREQGLIIGDQTGIGKGRQAAAIIRHSILHGYIPVFLSKSPNLFSDMLRDLKGIDFDNIRPFILNTDSDARIKDEQGNVVYSPMSSSDQKEYLSVKKTYPIDSKESIEWHKMMDIPLPDPVEQPTITISEPKDHLPSEYDCVFATYSQIQSADPIKRQWLELITEKGLEGSTKYKKVVFILDESHVAGGYDSIIGKWMRGVLPKTKACCYLSATFAKYPEVMPFYAKKTAISEAGLHDEQFVRSMRSGGLALQEIVASNLCESGQLIRRQRSTEGIDVHYIVLDDEPDRSKSRQAANRIIELMNEVVDFEKAFIGPILEEIHDEARRAGENMESKPRSLGVKQVQYFSRVFNIMDQMLFSLKVNGVADLAVKLLNEDKKVVIAFKSTMGAFLKDLNLVSGDVIPNELMDFVRTMTKGLDSTLYYNYTNIDGEKTRRKINLDDLTPQGLERYNEIRERMLEEKSGLSISPIDTLIDIIENTDKAKSLGGHNRAKFKVGEITGRNQRVKLEDGQAIVQSFRTDAEKFFRQFNNGELDCICLNQAGSTGASVHASKEFQDQRKRATVTHQFELDINIEIQKRGRTHRTGQVRVPEYWNVAAPIPLEFKSMTSLKSKMRSLDANTTGSQKTNDDVLESPDILNKYGDIVAWKFLDDNPDIRKKLGNPTYHYKRVRGEKTLVRNDWKDGAIKQVFARAGLLPVEEQEAMFDELLKRYEYQIKWEKQRGTYDLETEFLKLDANPKKRFLYRKGNGGYSPFGRDSVREETIVNNVKRPFTKDEVDELIVKALDGKKPSQYQIELVNEIKEAMPKLRDERRNKRMETILKLKKELEAIEKLDDVEDEKEQKKIEKQKERVTELIAEKERALNNEMRNLEYSEGEMIRAIELWKIGDSVKTPLWGAELHSWGIFLGVNINRGVKNPYTLGNITLKFAVTDSRKILEFNLTSEQRMEISSIFVNSKDLTTPEKLKVQTDWNILVRDASQKREKRQIITENIIGASGIIGPQNKLIKYNTQEGTIKNGILMSREFGQDAEDHRAMLPISDAFTIIKGLATNDIFSDHRNQVRFKRISDNYVQVYITKSENFKLYTDETLRALIKRSEGQSEDQLPDFVQNAGDMTAALHLDNLEPFLKKLDTFGLKYMGAERELEDWEIENEEDWKKKTDRSGESQYSYKLNRPYGDGTNPASGFISYDEPSSEHLYGVVHYNRPLTDKEKYNFSLIPIFKNVEEPYRMWESHLEGSPLEKEYNELVKSLKNVPLNKAIMELGYFITGNPHEDGNTEFVFGMYQEEDLGKFAYEDRIQTITPLNELIAQLSIELSEAA